MTENTTLYGCSIVIECLLTILIWSYLMCKYSNGKPLIAPIMTAFGWMFSSLMIFLVPLDFDAEISGQKSMWLAMSYTNMVLNYGVYPYMMQYINSAAFTVGGKICDSIYKNCIIYCLYLVCGAIALVVYYAVPSVHADVSSSGGPFAVGLAFSMAFAFVILSVFVGYGMVALPMHLWRQSSFQNEFEDSLITLANIQDRLPHFRTKVMEVCTVGRAARIASGVKNYEEMAERRD